MRHGLTREDVVRVLKEELPELKRKYGVTRIGLFGSFARGTPGVRSDVDILVETDRPLGLEFVNLADHLEKALGRRIDIATFDSWKRSFDNPRYRSIAENVGKNLLYV